MVRKKKKSVPKMTLLAILAASMVVLIVLVVWLVGELFKSDGGGNGKETGISTTEMTKRYEGLSSEENELVVLVERYRDEMLAGKNLTVKAGQISIDINPAQAGAPTDFAELMRYLSQNGLDTDLVVQYRSILNGKGIPEYSIQESYIEARLKELNTLIDTGIDSRYEINGDRVTIFRGTKHTVIDIDQVATQVIVSLKEYKYDLILANTWDSEPDEPDWDGLYQAVYIEPQNAKYEVGEDGLTLLVEQVPGTGIDIELMKQELRTGIWESKVFTTHEELPEITIENIEELYFKDVLGSKTTYYNTNEKPRTNNVMLAAGSINGYVVLPGEKFSFNKVVGERTEERGYQNASIYVANGVEPGLGGGICQVSSTLYNATLYANLKQFSRYYHAYTVSYVDLGMDATVYWGSLDYVFVNDTETPIQVSAVCKNGALTIKILGTKTDNISVVLKYEIIETYEPEIVEELDETLAQGERNIETTGKVGYKVEAFKTVTINGVTGATVKINTSSYKAINTKVKVGPPIETTAEPAVTTSGTTTTTAQTTGETTAEPPPG